MKLYATIKRSSKYAYQNQWAKDKGEFPFPVAIDPDAGEYVVQGGPGGQYRLKDVHLYVSSSISSEPFKIT